MTDVSGGYNAPYGHEEFNFEPFLGKIPAGMVRIGGISYDPTLDYQFRPDPAEGARIALRAAVEGREHGHPDTAPEPSADVSARLNALTYDQRGGDFADAPTSAIAPFAEGPPRIQPRRSVQPAPSAVTPRGIPATRPGTSMPGAAPSPARLSGPPKIPPRPIPQERNPWWDPASWYDNLFGAHGPSRAAPSGLVQLPLPLAGKVHPTPAPAAQGPSKIPPTVSPRIGDLSMIRETGYRPGQEALAVQSVSTGLLRSGKPDRGGVSWGAYQLASRNPRHPGSSQTTLNAFLASEGSQWRGQLTGDPTVRHGEFESNWLAVAKKDPQAFFQAQHAFIARTHYQPALDAVKAKTGVDISRLSPAVQNVVWSMAVQHGGAPALITEAVDRLKGVIEPGQAGYDRALINSLYDSRNAYVTGPQVKNPDLLTRYARERRDALGMLPKGE